MYTGIAFFRGINVGGKNVLPMKQLQTLMLSLGFTNVQTVIQSGNVVFKAPTQPNNMSIVIQSAVLEEFGFRPEVIVFAADELKEIINATPYTNDDGKLLHYFLMQTTPDNPDLEMLEAVKIKTEKICLIDNVLYLFAPDGVGRSKLFSKVEKAMGLPVTARNQNTLKKLLDKI